MKALVKYGYGKGETEIRDIPIPTVGDDDLLIEVKAAGICGSDLAFHAGGHENLLNPPVVLGHEFAGVVSQVGRNVTGWGAGDRVVSDNTGYVCGKCYACGTANYLVCPERLGLGYGMDGGFASHVKVPGPVLLRNPQCLFIIPDGVSFEEAAILDPCCNADKAVVQEGGFLPGEDLAVFGVGPLGLFAIQIGRAAGAANIIAIGLDADRDRFVVARKLGATYALVADREDVAQRVKEITSNEGVALVVDCAGPAIAVKQGIEILRNTGKLVKVGYDERPLGFSLDPVMDRALTIRGHYGYDYVSWTNCIKLVKAGWVDMKTMISHRLPLAEWEEGFRLTAQQKAIKVILLPEPTD
jgi:threonine dehydrogenase-like Zn-dependent dehydrogenase